MDDKKAKKKVYNARYWEKNRDRILEKRKEFYKDNKDKIISRNQKWIDENRERWNAYQREYRKKKKEVKKGEKG